MMCTGAGGARADEKEERELSGKELREAQNADPEGSGEEVEAEQHLF